MKNGSHRSNINRTRPRHGHKYTKYKMCLTMMIVMYNKEHLKKTLWPFLINGVQLSQGYRATTRRQFTFYHSVPRSSQH